MAVGYIQLRRLQHAADGHCRGSIAFNADLRNHCSVPVGRSQQITSLNGTADKRLQWWLYDGSLEPKSVGVSAPIVGVVLYGLLLSGVPVQLGPRPVPLTVDRAAAERRVVVRREHRQTRRPNPTAPASNRINRTPLAN